MMLGKKRSLAPETSALKNISAGPPAAVPVNSVMAIPQRAHKATTKPVMRPSTYRDTP